MGIAYFLLGLGVFRLVENIRDRRLELQVERLLVMIGEKPSGPCPECVGGRLTVRLSPAERDPLVCSRPFRFTCGACDFETKSASPVFYMDDMDGATQARMILAQRENSRTAREPVGPVRDAFSRDD